MSRRERREQEEMDQRDAERQMRQEERRAEREGVYDQIRAKYGLARPAQADGQPTTARYQRMSDEVVTN